MITTTTATKCFWKLIFKMRKRKSYIRNIMVDSIFYLYVCLCNMTLVYNIFLWYEQSQRIESNEWFGSIQCDWNVSKWNSGCDFFYILLTIKICIQKSHGSTNVLFIYFILFSHNTLHIVQMFCEWNFRFLLDFIFERIEIIFCEPKYNSKLWN